VFFFLPYRQLSSGISLYVALVKTSIHPTVVKVRKYRQLLENIIIEERMKKEQEKIYQNNKSYLSMLKHTSYVTANSIIDAEWIFVVSKTGIEKSF